MTFQPWLAAGWLMLVLTAEPTSSQSTSIGASEAIDVALVDVEVWVSDSDGGSVTNLDATDFQLLVDGQSLDIENFARVDAQQALDRRAAMISGSLEADHRLVVYIDTAFLSFGELSAVEPILADFLRQALPTSVPVLLASADSDFRILEGFTVDREIILFGIQGLTRTAGKGRIEREYSQIQREFDEALGRASSGAMPVVPGAQADSVLTRIGAFAALVQGEIERSAAHLEFLVQALRGLSGDVEVLFLTGRPPTQAGPALMEAWLAEMGQNPIFSQGGDRGRGGGQGGQGASASGLPDLAGPGSHATSIADLDAADGLRRAAAHAAAAGVTIHAIDLGSKELNASLVSGATAGQGVPGNPGGGFTRSASIDRGVPDRHVLEELAGLTGGELLRKSDLPRGLAAITGRPRMHYSLAFTPPRGLGEDPHEIEIRLTDSTRASTVTHRRFFQVRTHDQQVAQAIVSSMLLGAVQNPLEISLDLLIRRGEDSSIDLAEVRLVLPFSRIALRPDGNDHIGQLSVFTLWGEIYRRASPVRKRVLPIRVANDQLMTALGRSVEYSWEMEIPTGTPCVAVGIQDDLSHLLSTMVVPAEKDE